MKKFTAVYMVYVGMGHYVTKIHRMKAKTGMEVIKYVSDNFGGDVTHLFKGYVEEV